MSHTGQIHYLLHRPFGQHREASNKFYEAVPAIVEDYMQEINKITGRDYHLFNYYGAEDADRVIIAMGSVTEAAREAIDYLMAKGEKVGLVRSSTATRLTVLGRADKKCSAEKGRYK